MQELVTIVTLIIPFVFVIVVLWIKMKEKHQHHQLQADLYAKALEKGQPLPDNLFEEDKKQHNPLHTGIILIAVSTGIILFLWMLFSAIEKYTPEAEGLSSLSLVGMIPLLAGIAFLIIHFIEKKKKNQPNVQ